MPDIFNWLSGNPGQSVMVDTVRQHTKSEDEAQSLALRLLIHFYGDIHQPLHIVDRYTSKYLSGDKGGNAFAVKMHYKANELHAVWDSAIYSYYASIKKPFTAETFTMLGSLSSDLFGKYPVSPAELTVSYKEMKDESYAVAQTLYDGLTEGQALPDSYVTKYKDVI